MSSYQKTFTSNTAVTTIDLSSMSFFDPNTIYQISDFNIEVVGNAAAVTLQIVGPFSNSIAQTPEGESTFPIGGATLKIVNTAIGKLIFTRTGTAAYSINVTKSVN